MIEDAEDLGQIKPGDTLIEPTSGTSTLISSKIFGMVSTSASGRTTIADDHTE